MDDGRNSLQRVLRARGVERLSTQHREPIHLVRALLRNSRLPLSTQQQLRCRQARDQERDEDNPVKRIRKDERVVRNKEPIIENEERCRNEPESHTPPASCAPAQHDEQQGKCNVRLVELGTEQPQQERRNCEDAPPE